MNASILQCKHMRKRFKSSAKQIGIYYFIETNIILLPHIYFKNHRCVKMGQSTLLDEHRNM